MEKPRDIHYRVHAEFLDIQRRVRRLRNLTPSVLDPRLSLVLPTIACREDANLKQIANDLFMDASNFSRLVNDMRTAGYIDVKIAQSDRRQKQLSFTPLGNRMLHDALDSWQHIAEIGLGPLTQEERDRVGEYFGRVSDALGAPPERSLFGEECFTREQKRLARTLGMFGTNYLESGYDIYAYQLLYHIWKEPSPPRFRALAELLPLEPSAISRLIDRYIRCGLLKKQQAKEDKRGIDVLLTSKGKAQFEKLHGEATSRLGVALATFTDKELEELVALLQAGAECPAHPPPSGVIEVTRCSTDKALQRARAFLVEQLVRRDAHRSLGPALITEQDTCYLAEDNEQASALSVLTPRSKKEAGMIHLEFGGEFKERPQRRDFLSEVITDFSQGSTTSKISFDPTISTRFRQELLELGSKRRSPQGLILTVS